MQLDKKQEMLLGAGFGAVVALIGLLLLALFAGRSTLTCERTAQKQGECVYQVQSLFNQTKKVFAVSELAGSEAFCKRTSSTGRSPSSCFIIIKTDSPFGEFKMDYGYNNNQSSLLPIAERINTFAEDTSVQQVRVSQEGWLLIGIVSVVLIVLGGALLAFCSISFKKLR
jgi:hypothetical protein